MSDPDPHAEPDQRPDPLATQERWEALLRYLYDDEEQQPQELEEQQQPVKQPKPQRKRFDPNERFDPEVQKKINEDYLKNEYPRLLAKIEQEPGPPCYGAPRRHPDLPPGMSMIPFDIRISRMQKPAAKARENLWVAQRKTKAVNQEKQTSWIGKECIKRCSNTQRTQAEHMY